MPIPAEILAVERPKNTVVLAYGKNKDRYAVRERVGCRYVEGRRLPVNGATVGHIVDGRYVALPEAKPVSFSPVDIKSWAEIELADSLFSDVLDDLLRVYAPGDASKLYCIAVLRACGRDVRDCELKAAYDEGFLSELRPGCALSRNTVSAFLNDVGRSYSKIVSFMRERAERVGMDHHLLVDGTLKTSDSKVNTLSDFSFKSRVRGSRNLSVMYAFDLEGMEPVCSKCFPGNMLDLTAYGAFVEECGVKAGMIVSDKGIPASAAAERFAANPDLHYLNPIKRNAKFIQTHSMLEFTGMLAGPSGVTYRKEKVSGRDKWLYSFRDAARAAKEESDWLARAGKKGRYDPAELDRRRRSFGTIVLESDLDMDPEVAYRAYARRWEIEVVMRYYKNALGFDDTREHDDYSVIGSEFCDFLATVLTFRLIRAFDGAGLLERMTYGKVMSVLRRAKKVRVDGKGDWELVRTSPSNMKVLEALGLVPKPDAPAKRKRGRPKKAV